MTSRDLLIMKTIILTRPAQHRGSHQTATSSFLSRQLNHLGQIHLILWWQNDYLAMSLKYHNLQITSHKYDFKVGILKIENTSNKVTVTGGKINACTKHLRTRSGLPGYSHQAPLDCRHNVTGLGQDHQVAAVKPPWT